MNAAPRLVRYVKSMEKTPPCRWMSGPLARTERALRKRRRPSHLAFVMRVRDEHKPSVQRQKMSQGYWESLM